MLPLLLRHDKIKVIFPGYCVQVCKYDNIILYILKHIQLNVLLRSSKYYNYLIIEYHTIYIYIYRHIHIITFMHFWLVLRVWLQCKQDQRYLKITNWLWVKKTYLCCPAWLDVRQLLLQAAHDQFLEVHSPRAEAKTRVLNHLQVPLPKDRLEHTDEPKIKTEYANTLNSLNSLNVHKHVEDGKHQGDSSWRTGIL